MFGFLRPDRPHPCGDPDCTSADDDHGERHGLAALLLDGLGAE